jgi:cardiolipin synthase
MNLHRTTGKPDWADIAPDKRTFLQRVAAGSHGIVTPGNAATMTGFALVLAGFGLVLSHDLLVGVIVIAAGRLFDIIDGWVAHASRTKSPLGEFLDGLIDKITTIACIILFFIINFVPFWILIALLIPQVVIAYSSLATKLRNKPIHPSLLGKRSMAVLWLSFILFILTHALGGILIVTSAAYATAFAAFVMSTVAMYSYLAERK